ncbi:hypothetical protein Tco_0516404 [Tanacetum coccineum]
MNGKETSIIELHSLLKTAEQGIKKIDMPSTLAALVLTVGPCKSESKACIAALLTIQGHWSSRARYLKDIQRRRSKRVVTQGLKESRRLKHEELNLVMGNRTTNACDKDNVVFIARRGVFFEREMKSKEDSGNKIDFEEIQESADEESIVNIDTQQKVVTPVKPDDISLPIRKTSGCNGNALRAAMWKRSYKMREFSQLTNQVGIWLTLHPVLRRWDEVDLQEEDKHVAFHDYEIWQMMSDRFPYQKLTEDISVVLFNGMESRHSRILDSHWIAVRNIFKYLRKTKDRFLVYGGEEELGMTGYYDANWQTHKDDSRSQSGWLFLLNRERCEASKEAIWMKNFFVDLGFVLTVQDPIEIFYDNESAVALTNPRIRESQSILK